MTSGSADDDFIRQLIDDDAPFETIKMFMQRSRCVACHDKIEVDARAILNWVESWGEHTRLTWTVASEDRVEPADDPDFDDEPNDHDALAHLEVRFDTRGNVKHEWVFDWSRGCCDDEGCPAWVTATGTKDLDDVPESVSLAMLLTCDDGWAMLKAPRVPWL